MSSITFADEHFLDHEGRRALLVIAKESAPIVHNAVPVTFSFYVRSGTPYFTSKANIASLRDFCYDFARYLEASKFLDRTAARMVRMEVFDAKDNPLGTSVNFDLIDEQARNHHLDERRIRVRNTYLLASKELGLRSLQYMYAPVKQPQQNAILEHIAVHDHSNEQAMVESVLYGAAYQEEYGKEALQLLTDEHEYPHPGRGRYIKLTDDAAHLPPLVVPQVRYSLMHSPKTRWVPEGPQCPHPRGHMLNPKTEATSLILPYEFNLKIGQLDPFQHIIFLIDVEDPNIAEHSIENGLNLCFFRRCTPPEVDKALHLEDGKEKEPDVDNKKESEVSKDENSESDRDKRCMIANTAWSKDGTESGLCTVLLRAMPKD